ncbi:hypothetical protein DYB25_009203 [Aphanomyces astaci]|uniref:TORTIFOLIA1/SINE1-2 N-terminal domain-containing protein n=1 Tax=Aphanomyces astaci TaxID=112090 RepID=A0A397CZE6_APHAT|nr:hypothetical protein DYB25_009203 [Aphanomyces astaci]RHY47810.1 hypothetical protein DYB34_011710 [Aphanomyces astaci]RHY56041.1 hypothetical protein DYB38_013515 [Aphanomyces astaci]RHZ10988.1 hypothetical protein DYB26_008487 [Aphanomyces astaci]
MEARRKQHQLRLTEINDWVGKLEERDTEQHAFVQLIQIMPKLTSAQAYEMYSRLERNKDPARSSTREDIVLLMAALCKEHPVASARFLKKMVAYLNYRLRDKRHKVTDACMKATAAISLYVLPSLPQIISIDVLVRPFLNETNVMSDGAAKCIGAMLHPHTTNSLLDHATRIHPYLVTFVPHLVSRFHSAVYATYSPIFYILTEILRLAKVSFAFLDMLLAVEGVMQFGQRDDWVNRKRGIDLLIACLQCFPHDPQISQQMVRPYPIPSIFASPVRDSAAALLVLLNAYDEHGTKDAVPDKSTADVYAAAHPRPAIVPPASESVSPKRKKVAVQHASLKQTLRDDRVSLRSPKPVSCVIPDTNQDDVPSMDSADFAENVKVAMEEGNMELALRISLLSEDKTLLRRWLCFSQPSVQYFRETTLNALCAAFLDFLENVDDAALIFPWISCMLRDESHLQHVDARISRHMEALLAELSVMPTKEGLIAARLHHELASCLQAEGR